MPGFVLGVEDVRHPLSVKQDVIRSVHVTLRRKKKRKGRMPCILLSIAYQPGFKGRRMGRLDSRGMNYDAWLGGESTFFHAPL